MPKEWTLNDIKRLWPHGLGELQGFQVHLETTAPLTAAQLDMALHLAQIGFAHTTNSKTEQNGSPTVEQLDQMEALLDYILRKMNRGSGLSGIMMFTPSIDRLWTALKDSREKASRPQPKLY
jgi:hypothetical protein